MSSGSVWRIFLKIELSVESIREERYMAQEASYHRSYSGTLDDTPCHVESSDWFLQVTLATTVLFFINPFTRMGGTELVYNLFAECRTGSSNTHSGLCVLDPPTQAWPVIQAIATAMVVKSVLTLVTFGIKLPAGIFIPSLGGACRVLTSIISATHGHAL